MSFVRVARDGLIFSPKTHVHGEFGLKNFVIGMGKDFKTSFQFNYA